jgi:hypothetical protein
VAYLEIQPQLQQEVVYLGIQPQLQQAVAYSEIQPQLQQAVAYLEIQPQLQQVVAYLGTKRKQPQLAEVYSETHLLILLLQHHQEDYLEINRLVVVYSEILQLLQLLLEGCSLNLQVQHLLSEVQVLLYQVVCLETLLLKHKGISQTFTLLKFKHACKTI